MALKEMTDNVQIIQQLGTYPNQDDGLDAEGLKAKFDEGSKLIKAYINETLVPAHNELKTGTEKALTTLRNETNTLQSRVSKTEGNIETLITATEELGETLAFEMKSRSAADVALKNEIDQIRESPRGSGVYVGTGEMPEGYNVQIDPEGELPGVGLFGYYWFDLDTEKKCFSLSTTQLTYTPVEVVPWAVGDVISMADEHNAFTDCATITGIDGNVITVDSIPEKIGESRPNTLETVYFVDFAVWVLAKPKNGEVELGIGALAFGLETEARGTASMSSGYLTKAPGLFANAEGLRTVASGERSHAEGSDTVAGGACAHAEGYLSKATGESAHAEGGSTEASGNHSHTEGFQTKAKNVRAHAEGALTEALGRNAHAEGYQTKAIGKDSHAEGINTSAGIYKQDEAGNYLDDAGNVTTDPAKYVVIGECDHAEGSETKAYGKFSHTEGRKSIASGEAAHAEGYQSTASGQNAHAEGRVAIASGAKSHAEGWNTEAAGECQHVQGKYNEVDYEGRYAHIVGNGKSATDRSNAHTVDWDGNAVFAGGVTAPKFLLAGVEEGKADVAARLDALEAGYRHIATVTQDTDEEIKQIDVTTDSEGNAFLCSDFLIFLTLPTSDEIYNDYKTQVYIGHQLYQWEVLIRAAFSRTGQRKWRIHMRHSHDGWWVADGVQSEDTIDYAINALYSLGNIKSQVQTGKTVSELHFMTTAAIPNGTVFEIYGK